MLDLKELMAGFIGISFFFIAISFGAAQQSLQDLDASIQSFAFQRLSPLPKTGVVYNVTLPSSLTSISRAQAVRLRSGSLRRHGLIFNEFTIPVQSLVETTSKYVVLVYRSFEPSRSFPVRPPTGYELVAPLVGIKSFVGNDLNASSPQEVNIFSGTSPITASFAISTQGASCAFLDQANTFKLASASASPPSLVCTLSQLVDSSLALPSISPSLPPSPSPSPSPSVTTSQGPPPNGRRRNSSWKIGVGVAVGGIAAVMLLFLAVRLGMKLRHRSQIAKMQYYADNSETLQTALIGACRAPTAGSTRTKPVLENDYIPPTA